MGFNFSDLKHGVPILRVNTITRFVNVPGKNVGTGEWLTPQGGIPSLWPCRRQTFLITSTAPGQSGRRAMRIFCANMRTCG